VEKRGPGAWDERVSTSGAQKVGFGFGGLAAASGARARTVTPRPDLWSKI
jgi:phytoene synthase